MSILKFILEMIGVGWCALVVMIGIWGGGIKVEIKNPFTQKFDTITDVTIKK
ncbi:hypothetical protein N4T77_06730 [Clostridium sp. CX1]|uniref:hypothetical protein n=1 Tax=Clostridium sp. CX1 TaxID=2978346 RepID=UPI0021C1A3E1|nr:hypothetical protein [Clostridium sp. CX1]MCT8976287.1 hypothetical protein [Clostridium sp. CX1]